MTDNEIVKALGGCVSSNCTECPHNTEDGCTDALIQNAIDLIDGQRMEIDRLEIELKAMRGAANSYKAEVERLKKLLDEEEKKYALCAKRFFKEGVKEFTERLKSTSLYDFIEEYYENAELRYEVRRDQFEEYCDNLVKEMVGDEK